MPFVYPPHPFGSLLQRSYIVCTKEGDGLKPSPKSYFKRIYNVILHLRSVYSGRLRCVARNTLNRKIYLRSVPNCLCQCKAFLKHSFRLQLTCFLKIHSFQVDNSILLRSRWEGWRKHRGGKKNK